MSVEVSVTDANVAVEVTETGDVTAASISASVLRGVVEAVVDSSGGARGPRGPQGPPGDAGQSIEVHWDTVPPLPGQGNVGDLWVVVDD